MFRHPLLRLALLALPALILTASVRAGTISLAWDPVTHPDLAGYRVYYGTASGNYPQTQDTGLTTLTVLGGLASCTDYFLAVKAVLSDGSESVFFSNEISGWSRPIVSSAAPQGLERGATGDVTIAGANFRSGVTASVSNTGVTINGITVLGCDQLTLNLSVAASATLGSYDITVTDAGGITGTGAGVATVLADATAPSIGSVQSGSIGSTTATISWSTDEPADGQVFFREPGEATYQQTALDPTLTSSHTVVLAGLTPNTTYEYYVQSADGDGNTATANGPSTFGTSSNGFTYMRFEPENIPLSSPAEAVVGAGAFAGAWMQLAPGTASGTPANPSGTWDYGFTLPAGGSWHLWFRMYGIDANANAWFESTDGGSFATVEPSQNGQWEWVLAGSRSLSAGLHTLTLGGAEARARIDRVLITDDPAFQPTEQPGSDVMPPVAVSGLTAAEDDAEVVLGWTNPSDNDLARIIVRFRTDGVTPVSPIDGQGLIDRTATAGAADGVTHSGLTNGVTFSYAVFALDGAGNVSPRASIEATPAVQQAPPAQVQNLRRIDNQ